MTSLMLEPLGAIFLILLILESETLIQIKIEFLMHSNWPTSSQKMLLKECFSSSFYLYL